MKLKSWQHSAILLTSTVWGMTGPGSALGYPHVCPSESWVAHGKIGTGHLDPAQFGDFTEVTAREVLCCSNASTQSANVS